LLRISTSIRSCFFSLTFRIIHIVLCFILGLHSFIAWTVPISTSWGLGAYQYIGVIVGGR
jgi:Na+-transporting NADH:ubiquinone oxidoreductase subunit NqrE